MRVKEAFKFMPKSKIKATTGQASGKYPFFKSSDTDIYFLDNYLYEGEMVIIGTGGKPSCHYYNGKFSTSTDTFALEAIDKINPKYLYYFLRKNNLEILERGFKGSGLKHISKEYISNIDVPLKPIDEQLRIIDTLDKIDSVITLNQNYIKLLNELVKSRFNEMFSNLNKVELHEIADIIMGQSPESKYYNFDGEGLPFFQGKADFGDKFTNVRMYTKKWNKKAQKGSILMSVRAPVGPVNFASVDCAIGRGLCAINSKNNISNNEFLYNALAANEKEIALIGSAGTTIKAINKSQVYKILLPDAPIDLQNEFSTFVQQVDKLKFNIQESIKETQLLFDSLMQKYFG